jgi:hypothetical protein
MSGNLSYILLSFPFDLIQTLYYSPGMLIVYSYIISASTTAGRRLNLMVKIDPSSSKPHWNNPKALPMIGRPRSMGGKLPDIKIESSH